MNYNNQKSLSNLSLLTSDSVIQVGGGGKEAHGDDGHGLEAGRAELHPLFNSNLLEHIFGSLDVKSLKAARQTCVTWRNGASPFLQKLATVTIHWTETAELDYERARIALFTSFQLPPKKGKPPVLALPTFMDYVSLVTPPNVFFRNFRLKHWALHSSEGPLLTRFWLECGQHVRKLILIKVGFYEESYVRNVLQKWTPNLESVELDECRFGSIRKYRKKKHRKVQITILPQRGADAEAGEPDSRQNLKFSAELTDESEVDEEDEWFSRERAHVGFKDFAKFQHDDDQDQDLDQRQGSRPQRNENLHSFTMTPHSKFPMFPLQWKELFLFYPNLTTLKLFAAVAKVNLKKEDGIEKLLREMRDLHKENPSALLKIKELGIFSRQQQHDPGLKFRTSHFEQASALVLAKAFTLNTCSVDTFCKRTPSTLNPSVIGEYINNLSCSLKTLVLDAVVLGRGNFPIFPHPLSQHSWKNPSFPHLTDLRLEFFSLNTINLEFLEGMAKLKNLAILGWGTETPPAVTPQLFVNTITLKPINTLTSLQITENILTTNCMEKISQWFPNLTKFEAVLTNELLWSVYELLTNLVELWVHGFDLTDAGILGRNSLEANEHPNPPKEQKETPKQVVDDEGKDGSSSANPPVLGQSSRLGIHCLKRLRRVKINQTNRVLNWRRLPHLTDAAVYRGFLEMNDLNYLSLPETQISDDAISTLCARFSLQLFGTPTFSRSFPTIELTQKHVYVQPQPKHNHSQGIDDENISSSANQIN